MFVSCINCNKKQTCQKICQEVEKILPKSQTGRLKGEFFISPEMLEQIVIDIAFKLKYGLRKRLKIGDLV